MGYKENHHVNSLNLNNIVFFLIIVGSLERRVLFFKILGCLRGGRFTQPKHWLFTVDF